jgi:RNA polymerase sigma-70 factor (ECF subfamily)
MAQDQAGVPRPVQGAVEADETLLVKALRCREEAAFVALVRRYHSLMLRVAYAQVNNAAAAEEVVQETWLAVIKGIDSFAGRSSLRTWMFRILTNQASARLERDGRQIPFSALASADAVASAPSVDPSRFFPRGHGPRPFFWVSDPREWPEDALLAAEVRSVIGAAVRHDAAAAADHMQRVRRARDGVRRWRATGRGPNPFRVPQPAMPRLSCLPAAIPPDGRGAPVGAPRNGRA